jgi:hypothetical protein
MEPGSSEVMEIATTDSGTNEEACPLDGNPIHTTGGGTHAIVRLIQGIDMQIAGLREIRKVLEEFDGKGGEEIIELIGSVRSRRVPERPDQA